LLISNKRKLKSVNDLVMTSHSGFIISAGWAL